MIEALRLVAGPGGEASPEERPVNWTPPVNDIK